MFKVTLKRKTTNRPKSRLDMVKENKYKTFTSSKILKKFRVGKRLRKVGLVFLGIILVGALLGGIWMLMYLQEVNKNVPTPDKIFPEVPLATQIFDRNSIEGDDKGTQLYRLFSDTSNSEKVDINDIPDVLKASFMAAEDDDFYNHPGYDPAAIIRCAYYKIAGSGECGGSTLTQQLVKLATNEADVTIDRKIKELLTAVKVEQSNTKDQILEMYLRLTSYGSTITGIKTAAKFYFNKEPKDLTLAQSAILAGIVRNATIYSPTLASDTEVSQVKIKNRQTFILDQLSEKLDKINYQLKKNKGDVNGPDVITKEMIEAAKTEELVYEPPIIADKKAGHFVDYVLEELTKRAYNKGEVFTLDQLKSGGYKIYTSLDYKLQETAEYYTGKAGNDYIYLNMHNTALMTTIPSNGQIITMVGSKSYTAASEDCDAENSHCKFNPQVNVLTSSQSPGSTAKVMGYYLAFKDGKLAPGTNLPDFPIKIPGYGDQGPKNWDSIFLGERLPAREALRQSRNLTALQVMQLDGVQNYIDTGKSFGYTTLDGDLGISAILGGIDIYPLEHAQAFSVYANGGDLVKLDPILKIVDKSGETVYEANPERKNVADAQGVFEINMTLNRLNSLGTDITWDDRDVAGKTGTSEENKDAWLMMYSPDFVTLGWGGNNNNDPLNQNAGWPGTLVVPWVKEYMKAISGSSFINPKTPFPRPGFVYQGGGDCNDAGECQGVQRDWLIQGREPKRGDVVNRKVMVCKDQQDRKARPIDILVGMAVEQTAVYYRSPVPEWQGELDSYILNKYKLNNGGPKEDCTVDRTGGANGPFYFGLTAALMPGQKINIKGGVFTSSGTVTATSFKLDGVTLVGCAVAAANFGNFDITCDTTGATNSGAHVLAATATDSNGETNTNNVNFSLDSGLGFSALPPTPLKFGNNVGGGCSTGTCQYAVTITSTSGFTLSNIQVFYKKNGGPAIPIPGTYSGAGDTKQWGTGVTDPGGAGSFVFFITATVAGGGTFTSNNSGAIVVNP